jgi:hypothetical protein
MPKVNVNSKNNWLSTSGLVDHNSERLDQPVLSTSDVSFNKVTITQGLSMQGDLTIGGNTVLQGNLTVHGNSTIITSSITTIADNILLLNSNEIGAGVTANLSGIEVDRGSKTDYQFVFEETTEFFKVGQVGSLQAVATREDIPLSYGASIFNPVYQRFDATQTFPLSMTFNSGINSSNSRTGSVIVTGGIGATGNITIDGLFSFFGTNYNNNIKSNLTNDLLLNVDKNLYLNVSSGNNIFVPINSILNLGSCTITDNGTDLIITNNSGNVNFNTSRIKLTNNTFISWGTGLGSIQFDGTNMNINVYGQTNLNSILSISSSVSSTNPNTGSIVTLGGIGINSSASSVSSTNGGALSILGGSGIQGQLFVGKNITIGDTNIISAQIAGQGINFRSLQRTVSTTTNTDLTFNSFEGGIINGNSVVVSNSSTVFIKSSPTIIGGGILSNSYSLYIEQGNVFMGNTIVTLNNTIPSTSCLTGTFLLNGGIGINSAVNAVSYTNGGSITTSGGIAIGMDAFFGGKLVLGNSNSTLTSIDFQGTNFRSNNRIITTSSTGNIIFNSFEGGTISSSNVITTTSTVYISGSPIIQGSGSILSSYSFWVGSGVSRFDSTVVLNGSVSSVSPVSGTLLLSGGIGINCNIDATSPSSGGSITTAGGISSAKSIYSGSGFYSNSGNNNHITLQSSNKNRFSLDLIGTETGSNIGGNLTVNRYTDNGILIDYPLIISRSTGFITITNTAPTTSSTTGTLLLNGGIGINSTVNAVSYTNGGSITTSGGIAIGMDAYINGNTFINGSFNVIGTSNLAITNITNALTVSNSVATTINTGSISLTSNTGAIGITSAVSVGITSLNGGISLISSGSSNINTNTGSFSLVSTGTTINSGTGTLNMSSQGIMTINSGSSILNLNTTGGLNLGVTGSGTLVTIGDSLSNTILSGNVTIGGNLTVNGDTIAINSTLITINDIAFVANNRPTGISDGGFLIHRYQTPNDTAQGQVVNDTPIQTNTFGSGSSLPDLLVLGSSSSTVNNYYSGWWILVTSGSGINQARRISSYNGTTKTATLYSTSASNVNNDGLDLTVAPVLGDTYSLFDIPYAGIYYSAQNRELRFAGVPFMQSSGVFGNPTTYLKLHCDSLVLEKDLTLNSNLDVYFTNTRAFVVGQTGATSVNQYNFIVDTVNGDIKIQNCINTIGSKTGVFLNQLDSISNVVSYSSIFSQIASNVSGTVSGNLLLSTAVNGTMTTMVELNGILGTTDFNNNIRILSTTSSNSTSASIIVSGGITILETADATSISSGGGLTVLGGASITKSLFVGSSIYSSSTAKVSGNTLTGTEGSVNVAGDLVMYNSNNIYFNTGSGIPSVNIRSSGTKIIYKPTISSTSTDYSTGTNVSSLWNNVPTGSTFDWYLGTVDILQLNSFGITLPVSGTGIKFSNNTNIYLNGSSGNLNFVPVNSFSFRNTTDTQDNISISSNGLLTLGLNGNTIIPSNTGSIFYISGAVMTDATNTGTIPFFITSSVGQSTLTSIVQVTTTNAISSYHSGAVIQGSNETITNNFNVYIAKGNNIGTATNAYSLYIQDAPVGTITNSYGLYIDGTCNNYINGVLSIGSSTKVSGNTITSVSGSLNINGDLVLNNNTNQTIYFNSFGTGVPTTTTRSLGSKIVLLPNLTASSVDYSIGVSSNSLWYASGDTTCNHSWYLGSSKILTLDNSGLTFLTNTTNIVQKVSNDTTGMTICGGNVVGNGGAQIDIYGVNNAVNSGNLVLTGTNVIIKNGSTTSMTIESTGISIPSTIDANGTTGSLNISGGVNVAKSAYIGTNLVLNFNQPYTFNGDTSGRLNISSGTNGVANNIRYFTYSGNNLVDNASYIYGFGTSTQLTNTEFTSYSYNTNTTSYIISTNATGSGTVRPLSLQTGSNVGQMILNVDGSINLNTTGTALTTQKLVVSDTTESTGLGNGSLTVSGGVSIAKSLFVGSNVGVTGSFSAGVSLTQTITTSNLVNANFANYNNVKTIINSNEVFLSCVFTVSVVATNAKTSFIISLPFKTTSFSSVSDIVITSSGMYNDGTGDYNDIQNLRCYPNGSSANVKVVMTSGNLSQPHIIYFMARYTAN